MRRRILDWLGFRAHFRVRDFRARERFRRDYEVLARSLDRRLDFGSVYDVGCANGFLVEELLRAGHRAGGIERSPEVHEVLPPGLRDLVAVGDFTEARGTWDLVACVEVAEHIEPERSEELVASLVDHARRWIYFTAAPPGQRGRGHINCRPHREWIRWFEERRWALALPETDAVREDLAQLEQAVWLRGNSFVLRPAGH